MRVLVSGGSGFVGGFIVEELLGAGYEVVCAGRTPPARGRFPRPLPFRCLDLDSDADQRGLFDGIDAFVHAAFHHLPGRYRGGEGDDPEGFLRRNVGGSTALFGQARAAGVARAVFLSSRAVYGTQPPGAMLTEETEPRPDTLYGEAKLAVERVLSMLADDRFTTVSLRATGVYGEATGNKWEAMLADFLRDGRTIHRVATEVHGRDLARAARLVIESDAEAVSGRAFNVSDLVLDTADFYALANRAAGTDWPLPVRSDASALNVMDCSRLGALGWRPGGRALLGCSVVAMVEAARN